MSEPRARAAKARAELTETEAALTTMRTRALEGIAKSPIGALEAREHLYRTVQVIDALRDRLAEIVSAGEIEDHVEQFLKQGQPDV